MENNETQEVVLTRREKRERKRQARAAAMQRESSGRAAQIVGAVLVIGALVIGWQAFNKNDGTSSVAPSVSEVSAFDQVKGNPKAGVLLTEYSDFQCPACASFYPVVSQLVEEYGDRIGFVYRHYPLFSIHPNAEEAAWAAEAAGKQGKFWEMHDMLFDRQQQWSNERGVEDIFGDYAESLGLNREQWLSDYKSDVVRDKVEADVASGNRERVNSTPTFFVNGTKMSAPSSLDDFRRMIEMELSIAEGVTGASDTTETVDTGDVSIEVEGQGAGIQVENVTTSPNGQ